MRWRSLRVRLAVLGFLAIYVPVLLLYAVTVVTQEQTSVDRDDGRVEVTSDVSTSRPPWAIWTVLALAPAAAGLAWWWAGRAVRPIERIRAVTEDIEGSDLSRRIELADGPTEVVALAASFDAMLDRLERAADTQKRLIEETSHELRTPLSVLAASADVLLAHPEPTLVVYREGLERSKAAAARLRATIDELLVDARGRARTLDRRPADLMTIARDVVEQARVLAAARGVELALTGPEDVVCPLDGPTVTRAIANLVDNAIRHAPAGSAVEVDVQPSGAAVAVAVTDHGTGIPPAEQPHIFERFWRARRDGTGLGLPIARQVALAHGGDLTVTSPGPAGDGCVLRLTLRR